MTKRNCVNFSKWFNHTTLSVLRSFSNWVEQRQTISRCRLCPSGGAAWHHTISGSATETQYQKRNPFHDSICVCAFSEFPQTFSSFFFSFFFYYSLSSAHCFQPPHKEDRKSFLFFRITQALATRPSISNYEYIILFCRIEYLSKMFGEYLRNTHFSLLVFIQCRQNKKIFGLCTIKFFFFMLVANRDRSTNRKSEWAELCCYRGRKTSARERMGTFGWEGNPFARQEGYTPSFSPMAISFGRRVRTFLFFFF